MQDDDFRGVIGKTYQDSTPWVPPMVTPPTDAPNVVFVVLDDVGFSHLGCYGSTIETPRMDALAAGGIRYNNFHTTAMCSPTRACLLTGRNHHAAGMGIIADWCTGYPGYQGQVTRHAAMLPEMLRPIGYSTFAIGKWHLTRVRDQTAAGPFGQWPIGRGFDRFYGFLSAHANQWEPELYCDNHAIPTPRRSGYHLTEDLIDQTIGMIRDQQAAAPGKPFFAYLALGSCHAPHHAPRRNIEKYRGRFDEGWEVMRQRWFEKQLELGIIPAGTRLTRLNEEVRPWSSLSADEKRICAKEQEVFAGFLDHTDEQIGLLVDYLHEHNLMENTIIILMSDNGASGEGHELGDLNIRRQHQFLQESFEEKSAAVDELGSSLHLNNYSNGWGHAGNTPLKWFKEHTHGGGVRDPLIIHWPRKIKEGGQICSEFCHCVDILPTVLEIIGIPRPEVLNGVDQTPIDGSSLVYTFSSSGQSPKKRVQYFELLGNRGIWADGWKAVTHHTPGTDYENDHWELYHLDEDYSESEDLSERYPEKVNELVQLWWREAERNDVLPLDDRIMERIFFTFWGPPRRRWEYEQGMGRVSLYAAPSVASRSYRIVADVEMNQNDQGVILAVGGRAGGYVLFVDGGRLVHEYVGPSRRYVLESTRTLPRGSHQLAFEFKFQEFRRGVGTLMCDGEPLGVMEMEKMWPGAPNAGGVYCGYDDGSPVSDRYSLPFAFTGKIHRVIVESENDGVRDLSIEKNTAFSEQ